MPSICAVNDIVDVDALFGDVEVIGPFTVGDDDIEIIGSPAKARALGVNKSLRNFKSVNAWKKAQKKEIEREAKRKQDAIDLTIDD